MVEIKSLNGKNWKHFLSFPKVILILSRSDCTDCEQWYHELSPLGIATDWNIGKMDFDQDDLTHFKQIYSWVDLVDMVPYTTVFINGEMVDSWAGSDLLRFVKNIESN